MLRRFLGVAALLSIVGLLFCATKLNRRAEASPQELTVMTRTKGHEELKATVVNGRVRFFLKNNHQETITAFVLKFGDLIVKEDFAYSDVHWGIEPGDTFEKSYAVPPSPEGSPTVFLVAVILKNGVHDGDAGASQEIKDERLGEKIQIHRSLKVLEKERLLSRDLKAIKNDVLAALSTGESEARISLNELRPDEPSDNKLSTSLKNGLQWGREKMLQRFEFLERLPTQLQEQGFSEFKNRSYKLYEKL